MATQVKRSTKTVLARVITQCNYFHRNKQKMTKTWLMKKAVGSLDADSSTVDKYVAFLKKEGYVEQTDGRKGAVFVIKKAVPEDLKVS